VRAGREHLVAVTELQLVASDDAVAEHRFELFIDGEPVPGLLWTAPGNAGTRPAVLMGHGRGGNKRDRYMTRVAQRLVRRRGWTAVALDAPEHGERRPPGADLTESPPRPDPDQVIREWRACMEFLEDRQLTDRDVLGYWGLSMGSAMGIPFLAADPRVRCAVLGLMHPRSERVRADAARISCPVLFIVNWDDTRVPRAEAFELFDAIGAADKRLHAQPGEHGNVPEEEFAAAEEFFARYLTGDAE
jgi:dienelactone hydrolase